MQYQKPLLVTWFIVFIVIGAISYFNRQESTAYFGVAESKEIIISSGHAVEINQIAVVPGQEVKKGELLVKLTRPDLSLKINEIAHQIQELKMQKVVKSGDISAQIQQIKAEQSAALSELNFQIKQIQSKSALNRQLTDGLKSLQEQQAQPKGGKMSNNPIQIRIDGLRNEKEMVNRMARIKLDALRKALNTSGDPVKVQIESLEKELTLFQSEQNKLDIYASINGIIGSVNFKPGEKASPFTPVLSLHSRSPSSVMGYIHENVYHRVKVGDKVSIHSLTGTLSITGAVAGVGARIVAFPVRLQKRPDIRMWGREVQIHIPERNGLLLGEKVLIKANRF